MTAKVPVERMGKRERAATPPRFARYLLNLVEDECGGPVAALWVAKDTVYRSLINNDLVWDANRDARRYEGPSPIVAHPPCGPWGRYFYRSGESRLDGILAMRFVHLYGGVVEQPRGSSLFTDYGSTGRVVEVTQDQYGHRAEKATLLYIATSSGALW